MTQTKITSTKSCGHRYAVGLVALVAGVSLGGCGTAGKRATPSPTTSPGRAGPASDGAVNLQAGLNDPKDPNIAVLQYLPQSVTVTAGSTVEWRIAGPEPHSVTFLAPGQTLPPGPPDQTLFAPTPAANGTYDGKSLVNSGLVPQGPGAAPPFRLSFPSTQRSARRRPARAGAQLLFPDEDGRYLQLHLHLPPGQRDGGRHQGGLGANARASQRH